MSISHDSSPDPLALSYDGYNTPMRPSSPVKARSVTPGKQQQIFTFDTPGKGDRSFEMTSFGSALGDRRGSQSPWKIKVTVEAEPDARQSVEGVVHNLSPSRAPGVTRTIMVPTKMGEEALSSPRKRVKQKHTPPAPRRKRTNEDSASESGTDVSARRRKASAKVVKESQQEVSLGKSPSKSPKKLTAAKPKRGLDFGALTPLHKKKENVALLEVPDLVPPWAKGETKSGKSIKGRVCTPRKPKVALLSDGLSSSFTASSPANNSEVGTHFASEDVAMDDEAGNAIGMDDDTTVLDRSVAESEGFSMVSIDALRKRGERASRPEGQTEISDDEEMVNEAEKAELDKADGMKVIAYPNMSSRSPTNTSPGPSPNVQKAKPQHQSVRVATQYLGSNFKNVSEEASRSNRNPDLFAGFGDGTRRELKKGLMIGELMARGEKGFVNTNTAMDGNLNLSATVQSLVNTSYPRLPTPADSQEADSAPSTSKSQISFHKTHVALMETSVMTTPGQPASPQLEMEEVEEESVLSHSQRMNVRFQRERDDVIREIEEANTSQVIRIESDDEESSEDEDKEMGESGDIWQDEADRLTERQYVPVEQGRQHADAVRSNHETRINLNDLFAEDLKPPRSKLPRTWRRTSGNDFRYSDEAEEPESDSLAPLTSKEDAKLVMASDQVRSLSRILLHPMVSPVNIDHQYDGVSSSSERPANLVRSIELDHTPAFNYRRQASAAQGSPLIQVYSPEEESIIHSSPPASASHLDASFSQVDTSGLSTSDVRQLRRELAFTTPRTRKMAMQFSGTPVLSPALKRKALAETEVEEGDENLSLLQPTKKYPRLFDEARRTQASAPKDRRGTARATPTRVPTQATHMESTVAEQEKTSLLARIANWVFVFPTLRRFNPFSRATASIPPQLKVGNPEWTKKHWALLHFFYSRSANLPRSARNVLPRYYPETLPAKLAKWEGHVFRSTKFPEYAPNGRQWMLPSRGNDLFTANAFIIYAKDPSARLMKDENDINEIKYLSAKEDWGTEAGIKEVLRSIFSHRVCLMKHKEKAIRRRDEERAARLE